METPPKEQPAVEDDLFMSILRGENEYEWEDGTTPDQKIAVLKAIVDNKQQQFAALEKRHNNLKNGIFFAAVCVCLCLLIAVSVFPRAAPTYCDKLMTAAHALENSDKDEDDEMKVLETKAREALKPLVQDCLEMADELR
jgi:hypothetical protein